MVCWFELDKRYKTRNGLLKLLTSNKLSGVDKKQVREKLRKISQKQCEEFYKAREAYDRILSP
jgi:hypothetical protein